MEDFNSRRQIPLTWDLKGGWTGGQVVDDFNRHDILAT